MSARLEVEDVQTTKGDKLLAVILTGFLLMGGTAGDLPLRGL